MWMHVRWFGQPWGVGGRAPICEDDSNKIDVPIGTKCLECEVLIHERDTGVVTGCSPGIWGHWTLHIEEPLEDEVEFLGPGPVDVGVCSYHLHCWLKEVIGNEIAGSILARMNYRVPDDEVVPKIELDPEDVEPGRGWKHDDA